MSDTKIVIDKEKVGKSEHSEIINAAISVLIKHGVATEIQIDQSIEEIKIKLESAIYEGVDNKFYIGGKALDEVLQQQQIIEQLKVKECYSLRDMADCWREAQKIGGGKRQMTQPFKRFIDSLTRK